MLPSTQTAAARPIGLVAAFALLVFPWLSPLASGPSASVQPWLVSAACVCVLGLLALVRVSPWLAAALAAPVLVAWPGAASLLDLAGLAGALMLIGLSCGFASTARADQVRIIVAAWWMAALASTAMGLLQYFGASDAFAPLVSNSEAGQAYANLRQRNQFASLTAIGVAALLWEVRLGERVWLLALLGFILGVGNAASVSRTGLMELLMLSALVVVWPGRSRAQGVVAGAAMAGYAAAAFALPMLLSAFTGAQGLGLWQRVAGSDACSSRSVLWSNVVHLIGERPWTGWGWGELDYAHYANLYPGARFCDILDNAHSLPLHVAVELGLPFALFLFLLLLAILLRARPWSEAGSTRQLAWSVVFIIGLHSLLEYPLWYGPFQIALGLALGLLWPAPETGAMGRRAAAHRWAVIGVFAVALLHAAWDYRRVSQVYLSPPARMPEFREDPLPHIRGSYLFRNHADFAELTLTPLTQDNAAWTFGLARELLHYSPEPRVIQKIVESGVILKKDNEVAFHLQRWKAAFPDAYAEWVASRDDKPAQ